MNKALLLIPLILSISLIPFFPNSFSQTQELEECRDGFIIVYLTNAKTFSCKSPETAERWQELGLAEIVDPSYEPKVVEEEPPKSILENIETGKKVAPIPEPAPFETASVENRSETATQTLETVQNNDPPSPPPQANNNELPGTPRKVGQQGVLATGYVVIDVYDQNGNQKYHREDHNLVVDNGLETLADLAFGTSHSTGESAGGFTWISVGTGGVAPAAGDTDCTQHGSKKQDVSVTNTALGAVINVSWVSELGAATIQEICLTDSGTPATGNLFSRQTYTGIPITATDTVNAEWTITFADSNGT